jgi:CDP-diacylglycerol--glycerol-3-phosphate 3-phosphatidyltransferase
MSRILLMVPVVYLFLGSGLYHREWSVLVVLVAMVTDALDGYVARIRNEVSEVGMIIDPLADKIGIGIVVVLLTVVGDIALWYMLLIMLRDAAILAGGVYVKSQKNIVLTSTMEGKVTVFAIGITLVFAMLGNSSFDLLEQAALWVSVIMIVYSFAIYTRRFAAVLRNDRHGMS